jgi:hypothetical protein
MNSIVCLGEDEAFNLFTELDAWAIIVITANSERLFGWAMSEAQVVVKYHPCLKHKEEIEPMPLLGYRWGCSGGAKGLAVIAVAA